MVEAERNKFRDFLARVPKRAALRNAAEAVEMVEPMERRDERDTLSVEALKRRSKILRDPPWLAEWLWSGLAWASVLEWG